MDGGLAEIRGWLVKGESEGAWLGMCQILEGLKESEREMLVLYVSQHTKGWGESIRRPLYGWWEKYRKGELTGFEEVVGDWSRYAWEEGKVAGEAREVASVAGMKMRWIPAGHFLIGAGADDKEDSHDEKPQHEVAISRGFWMGQTPVTQGQYLAVMGDNPSYFTEAGLEAPVEQVTWFEAAAFANKLSALEGASESFVRSGEEMDGLGNKESDYVGSNGWRLPTEAEWEYACRAGRTTLGYGDLEKIAWWDENSGETTHAVGQKQANAWGLHDMLGNVWEWCYDWHEADPRQAATDPVVAAAGMYRVLRGGCWDDHAYFVRLAPRGHNPPTGRYSAVGFRVVRLGLQSGLEVSSSTEPE